MRLFDLHCDTLYACCLGGKELWRNDLHIDWDRGLRQDAWAQVFAVWTPDSLRGEAAWQQARRILRFASQQAAEHPDRMKLVTHPRELDEAIRDHVCAGILALESGAALAGDLRHLTDVAGAGVKIIGLTWNGENECGYGCGCGHDEGLKPFGKALLKRMDETGMIADVSHLNRAGFWDVVKILEGPFLASHSVSDAVYSHPRNLTDEQFDAIRQRGGLVGINLCEAQLGGLSFEWVERHLYHFLSRGGERTVAFGCDFDGTDLPREWGGVQVMPELYEYLYRKNYEERCLERLFFSNCYDFFAKTLTGFDKERPYKVL